MGLLSKLWRRLRHSQSQADTPSFQSVPILIRDFVPKGEVWIIPTNAMSRLPKLTQRLRQTEVGSDDARTLKGTGKDSNE